jgi:hypothetical protein
MGLPLLAPLIIYRVKRNQSQFVAYHSLQVIYLHLGVMAFSVICFLAAAFTTPLLVAVVNCIAGLVYTSAPSAPLAPSQSASHLRPFRGKISIEQLEPAGWLLITPGAVPKPDTAAVVLTERAGQP